MVSTSQNTMGTGTMCKWMNKGIKKGSPLQPKPLLTLNLIL